MPRQRTYPRFEGKLLLHEEPTLTKLPKPEDEASASVMLKQVESFIDAYKKTFLLETTLLLTVVPYSKGWRWCVPDNALASARYKWLQSKALKAEANIVKRLTNGD